MDDYVLGYTEDGVDGTLYLRCSGRAAELMAAGLDKDPAITGVTLKKIEQALSSVDYTSR